MDIRSLEAWPVIYLHNMMPSISTHLPDPKHTKAEPVSAIIEGESSNSKPESSGPETELEPESAEPDILVERGRKFIGLTNVSHMTYDALTVGERQEEVSLTISMTQLPLTWMCSSRSTVL
jgi:hypothetical protein